MTMLEVSQYIFILFLFIIYLMNLKEKKDFFPKLFQTGQIEFLTCFQ